jgi:rhamnose transport system permease protein
MTSAAVKSPPTKPSTNRLRAIFSIFPPQQLILIVLLIAEMLIFSRTGKNFMTSDNFFQIARQSVVLGLLALAMTPVILTGGIDLSVGSLLGLCVVSFGKLWRDGGLSPIEAAAVTVVIGAVGGGINALLITRMRIPALIVTLGSFSLYRGLAIGITRGSENYTGFPDWFLWLGNGNIANFIPAPLPIFVIAAIFFWLLVHRSGIGRALSAIGFSPQGARYAGIPVNARIALVYILSGLCAAVAAIINVARVGQATADAGTGYELQAITAVVLGGTSIFGGRASVVGTVLGLFAIAVLQKGLRLSIEPPELAGILTGLLLLIAIGLDWTGASKK